MSGFAWYPVFFFGPLSEVDQFAAFAAERAEGVVLCPGAFFLACRAANIFFLDRHDVFLTNYNKKPRKGCSLDTVTGGPEYPVCKNVRRQNGG